MPQSPILLPFETIPDAILLVDADGRICRANALAERLFGYDPGELDDRSVECLLSEQLHVRHREYRAAYATAPCQRAMASDLPLVGRRKDGGTFPIDVSLSPWIRDGLPLTICAVRDLSARQQTQRRLQEAEQKHRALVEQLPLVIYQVSARAERELYVSPQLTDLLGYTPAEMQGDPYHWRTWLHPDDAVQVVAENSQAIATGSPLQQEFRVIARDGRVVWVRNEAVLVRDDQDQPRYWQGIWLDITPRKALEEELVHLAYHDPLTGLANRAHFVAHLTHALDRARRRQRQVAVIAVDLDNFKLVNDSLGHEAGDQLLGLVAERLRLAVREEDVLARFGGDEFAVLLKDLPAAEAATPAIERLQAMLRGPVTIQGYDFFLNASLGLACTDMVADQAPALLRAADMALYTAKRAGKGSYAVYAPAQETAMVELLLLERDLRRGLACDEFRVYYQPVVALSTGQIVAVEALVRWLHPTRGVVCPDAYIALAEERGLIVPLGQQVWQVAFRQLVDWQHRTPSQPPFDLSLNVSPRELREPTFVTNLTRIVATSGWDPQRLRLEITEGLLLAESVETRTTLKALKALGIRLVIDDFGTGYSSLAYLKRFSVDGLKIDQAFIPGLGVDVADTALVRAIIAAADALNLEVTAEGVETAQQAAQLRALGCHYAQGYFFGRPQPPAEFERQLSGRTVLSEGTVPITKPRVS